LAAFDPLIEKAAQADAAMMDDAPVEVAIFLETHRQQDRRGYVASWAHRAVHRNL
jgi:hypothetical protein